MSLLRKELGLEQQMALDIAESGSSVAILGVAGSGKSELIRLLDGDNTMIFAPTGISALNVGGETCHRGFKIPLGLITVLDRKSVRAETKAKFRNVDRIVIDEGLMVRRDAFEHIDYVLRQCRNKKLPFGGIQMIIVGDGFQLPPVVGWNERQAYYSIYESEWAFTSEAWDFPTVVLTKVFRQDNPRQVKILNSIRIGDKWRELALKRLIDEAQPYTPDPDVLTLCCFKADAELINNKHYGRNIKDERIYWSLDSGKISDLKSVPVAAKVCLKEGIRVMVAANDEDAGYYNGDMGYVRGFLDDAVQVELDRGPMVWVAHTKWEIFAYSAGKGGVTKTPTAVREQIPLLLGYAITVHKAQGSTLGKVAIDLGRGAFAKHQFYVAISRVRDLTDISFVKTPRLSDIQVDAQVQAFYKKIEAAQVEKQEGLG